MNLVILTGRLAKDPELRYTPGSNTAVTHFTLAVDREGKDKQTDFLRITCFGKTAEIVDRYLRKGRQCGVRGKIQTGSYQDKNGKTVYTTDILAEKVEFYGNGLSVNEGEKSSQRSDFVHPAYTPVEDYDLYEQLGFEQVDDDIDF